MIDNRRRLQLWTSLTLSTLMVLLGIASAGVGIHFLRDSLERQIAEDNVAISETLRILVTRFDEDAPGSMTRIQELLEAMEIKGWKGFACVVDKDGTVVAHPNPEMRGTTVSLETYLP